MDIKSGNPYPSNALSNFAPHPFVFRGVECASMEGLLQSLKFNKSDIQKEVCKLTGYAAKSRGRPKNWQKTQTLWWNGVPMQRQSEGYKAFLLEAYEALAQNELFRKALIATKDAVLTHSIGRSKETETILTKNEFCGILHRIRNSIKENNK